VLLLSAEESARQVRLRAERLGPVPESLLVLAGTDLRPLGDAVAELAPALVVVDSIQTVVTGAANGGPGSMAQVRACSDELVALAKGHDVPVVLVGHVTKEGALAGPRALEHVVDTVLTVEGDRHHSVRLLRSVKHRFAPTGELGLFEMGERGLAAVLDPYRFLLGDRRPGVPGSAVLAAVEGQRALLVELQALVAPHSSVLPPRRSAKGVDSGRFTLVLAVLERRTRVFRGLGDVFASVVGGIRVVEPAADLALALAVASSVTGASVPADLVAFGEIGLGGEIRQVPDAGRRLVEAARVGFRRALVPAFCPDGPDQLELVRVHTLDQAVSCTLSAGQAA
jgi:DNA repair protein RadA/Sms